MPLQIDFGLFLVANAIIKLINQTHPLIKIRVLNGIAIFRCAIVVNIRTKAIASQHALFARNGHIDLHALGEDLPAGSRNFDAFLETRP